MSSTTNQKQQQSSKPQDDTLEQCNEKLRDVYMNYKDLVHRCLIDIKQTEKGEKRIFYFKPESFLLQDPEKQKAFRDKLIKRITAVPSPEPITFMGDELHKQLIETIQDQSQPQITRKNLAQFYKRRHYTLQHKKYKVLVRWAHHALTTEYMERIGHEATFKYGKMEYEMENAINRCDRLEGEDDFENAKNFPRPNTKAKEGGSLYVENTDLDPVSSIRMDDIEVYLRQITYQQKINKLVNKYLARLKWMPLHKRYEIWTDAVESYNTLKQRNLKRQEDFVKRVLQRGEQTIPKNNQDQLDELELIIENYNVSKQRAKITNKADQILNSQKSDYEYAPHMIENSIELKLQILDKSLEYGIYGDIELDQGYSFAYQITIFFPTYFQRQIIKSQFSIYDAFAGEEKDQNNIQKRNLQNMVKIDTNIFKDISTTKNNIPSQESLNIDEGFRSIKVIRLKSSAYWIDYCAVIQPKVSTVLQKQAAFMNHNNPIDTLLRSALNFLDVNDLATVNRILEETARLHQAQQKDKFSNQNKNKKKKNTQQNRKEQGDDSKIISMQDEAINIRDHFFSALKGDISQNQKDIQKELPSVNQNSLRYLPQHMIHAYYLLRHMKSRDYKTKLLYSLNYFRAIQKRMMLDLREFATRERILGDLVQPIIPANEADKTSQINANSSYFKNVQEVGTNLPQNVIKTISSKALDSKALIFQQNTENDLQQEKQFTVFEDGYIKAENNILDMKKFKFKGKFNNKIFSTCPSIPRFHATFGEPIEFQPLNVEMERIGSIKHATDEGVKLMGRVDHIEIDDKTKEVYVKDDFGIYILYDCSFQDMKDLEEEILKIGSYFIAKHEVLVNTENEKPYPLIDRLSLMEDILQQEQEYQFKKVELIQCYMECYEHISDPLEQQRLMQIIVDLMAMRPRLNLQATYFRDSYQAEIDCLNKQIELLRMIITYQMKIEKEENRRTQAYLDLTYKIANEQVKGKWTYADAEDFFNELKKRKATMRLIQGGNGLDELDPDQDKLKKDLEKAKESQKNSIKTSQDSSQQQKDDEESPTRRFLKKITDKQYGSQFQTQAQDMAQMKEKETKYNDKAQALETEMQGGFAAVLGLPPITVESLYMQYKEKDEAILDIMNENANFIRVYEGYPDFLIDLTGLQSLKLCQQKFNEWGEPINVLDFFDSLNFITKFYATIQSTLSELQEVLKPHDSTLLVMIETKILERAFIEYQKSRAFLQDDLKEYKGAEYLEDETIVGNSDKLIFYTKDMVTHFSKTMKQNINPFLISKLDIETINFFEFPSLSKELNPYIKALPQLKEDMEASLKIAEQVSRPSGGNYQRFFPQLKELMRKINIPSMLNIQCNVVEMLRLRQELLFAASESVLLQEIYENQCKMVNRQNFKVLYTDQINFENYLIDVNKVNFIDDGPAKNIDFDLAISEFDNMLKSNLNFRNPDAIKMLVCTSGLEELRAILHYQLMQKQLLIIGVRMNQLLIDTHMRALGELELAKKGYSIPNMIIKLPTLLQKTGDGFSLENYQREKQRIQSNLVNEAAPVFYYIGTRKAKLRNTVSKKFSVFLTSVASTFSKVECSLRVLRTYKLKLLHSYCKEVLKEAYHDAVKIQAVNTCQKLRMKSHIFDIDEQIIGLANGSNASEKPQVFQYEHTEYLENFFNGYNPFASQDFQSQFNQKPNPYGNIAFTNDKCELVNYFMIPSTISLMKSDSINYEELSKLNQDFPSFEFISIADENEVEASLKLMLPKLKPIQPEYPKDDYEKDRISIALIDFEGSYNYGNTSYAQLFTYYALIQKIFKLKFFIQKINSNLIDQMTMEQTILNGLPFWSIDSETEYSLKNLKSENNKDKLSEKILNKIIAEKRAKVNLADDIINFSNTFSQFIKFLQTASQNKNIEKLQANPNMLPKTRIIEYLISKHEYIYQLLVHTLDKAMESYYQKGSCKEVKTITEFYSKLIKKDHVKVSYKYNSFHSNASLTRPEQFSLESSNLFYQYSNFEEKQDFNTSIMPLINEHALNPPQITLIEGIYANQKLKSTQFVGQIPDFHGCYVNLETGLINLSEQERSYINSTIHSVQEFMKDYLEVIFNETVDQEGLLNLPQLKKAKKFLSELIQAKQLKNALICWLSNSTLPLDTKVYQQYLQQYKNDIFWKIMNQKDQLPSVAQDKTTSQILKQNEVKLKEKNQRAEQSMLLSQQLMNMQIQVLIDQVQTCKAETIVLSNEIERQIVKAAVKAVDSESAALANCFSISTKSIDMHIHPFQQFASTCYPQVDQNSHLDMVTKVSEVQRFVTKLRNRGTEVETLTSGPGMVFTIKDFNECLQILCRGLIKYSEREMRARSEDMAKKEQHFITLLYIKDRKIENLEERINNTRDNLDKLINSKMYEKGNQLIYELDLVNRQLRLFKDNVFAMERELRSNIRAEFADTLRKNMRDIDTSMKKFQDFKTDVTSKVKADLAQEQHKIEKILKKKAEEFKNLSNSTKNRESPLSKNKVKFQMVEANDNQHALNQRRESISLLEQVNLMSEREARLELAQMWDKMRKLRIFWKTKEVLTIDKYEKEILTLKKQQTSNACLWEQLAEAEKRERVLKQELIFTQQSLAASEKVIEKLKDDLRKSESDRIRLNQYKTNKSQRLEELEGKVRKFEVLENINLEKLIDTLGNKEKEIIKLKDLEKNFNQRLDAIERRKDNEIRDFRGQYQKELTLKKDVLERLEGLRMELRMLEKNEGSMAEVWKTKCKELVEICNNMKNENEQLRQRLILAPQNSFHNGSEYDNISHLQQENSFQLPKLMPNSNFNKMLGNIQASKYGATTHTRHSSVAKNESQLQGPSLDKSMMQGSIGLYNEISTMSKGAAPLRASHQRGKSINDSQSQMKLAELSQSRMLNNQQNASNQSQINSQRFAIKGQQAHIMQAKGYQSVRTSQVGLGLSKPNEDMADLMTKAGSKAPTLFKHGGDLTNTTTSFNKQLLNSNQRQGLAAILDSSMVAKDMNKTQTSNDKAVGQSSEMSKSKFNDSVHSINRKASQDRYGTGGIMGQGSLSSAGSMKKKSNNLDISGFIQTEVNSPDHQNKKLDSNFFMINQTQKQASLSQSQNNDQQPFSDDQNANMSSFKRSTLGSQQ